MAPCRKALELGLPAGRQPAIEATLAARLSALERWEEVVEVYRGAVSRRPADGLARSVSERRSCTCRDRAADAEPELREAIRLRPDDAEAQVLLGDRPRAARTRGGRRGRVRAGPASGCDRSRPPPGGAPAYDAARVAARGGRSRSALARVLQPGRDPVDAQRHQIAHRVALGSRRRARGGAAASLTCTKLMGST